MDNMSHKGGADKGDWNTDTRMMAVEGFSKGRF